jgi:TRAP-type C4-dicarboxylate transport system permease small subunit
MITALERFSGVLSALFIAIASVFLVAMALVGAADVVSWNLFGVPVPAANEIASAMLPVVVMMAMSFAQRRRDHIRVDIISAHFPPPLARAAEVLYALVGLAVFTLLAIGAWELAMKSVAISERAIAAVRFPVWPAKLVFAAGATAVGVELLVQLLRALVPARSAEARP